MLNSDQDKKFQSLIESARQVLSGEKKETIKVNINEDLDESKLLLESEKYSLPWIIEQITAECEANPECNLTPEEIAAIAAGVLAMLNLLMGVTNRTRRDLIMRKLAEYLAQLLGMDPDDVAAIIREMLENQDDIEPILNPDYVPPPPPKPRPPTPDRYHPSYPMHP